jgi:hypothetical protein
VMRGGDIAAQREVLATLIEQVVPVRIGRGVYGVEIVWAPLGEALQVAHPVTPDVAIRVA